MRNLYSGRAARGPERAAPGSLKAKVAALEVGQSLPCDCRLQRNTLYIVARRLGMKLKSENNTMKRIQ